MEIIHESTYSLEVAIQKMQASLEEIAVVLEEVHLAAETVDAEKLRALTLDYLEMVAPFEPDVETLQRLADS